MTADSAEGEEGIPSKLVAMVQEAEEWYAYLRKKHDDETRTEIVVVALVAFVAVLIGAALSFALVFHTFVNLTYLLIGLVLIPAAAGVATWAIRRRRRFTFAELGSLVAKMKSGQASAEDGLRLADAMHDALLAMKKGKMDSAFTNGVVAFLLVAVFGLNIAVGLLTGAIVYLYFRFEALRDYENESRRYEESKKELLQSL